MRFRLLSLFSGIGGFSLGLQRTGHFETVAFCERDAFPASVLRHHWPSVPIYDDVCTLTAEQLAADGIRPNVISGGFPCQDISYAGLGAGLAGARSGLWWEYHRLIKTLGPEYAIIENVDAIRRRGLGAVLRSLSDIGYDAEWHRIAAADVGAPHLRRRIWIVAYKAVADADHPRLEGYGRLLERAREQSPWKSGQALQDGRLVKPGIRLLAHGVPGRVGQLRCYGNTVVPQITEAIGRAILQAEGIEA